MNKHEEFDENYYEEIDDWYDYEEEMLPTFELRGIFHFCCPDGFVALDIKEAKKHGYGNGVGKGRSMGIGPSDGLFEKFDFSFLPEIENFSMEIEKTSGFLIRYYDNDYNFKSHYLWYTSHDIEDGKLKPLVGTPDEPYDYIDQGILAYIFEKDGFVIVLKAIDWEAGCLDFTGFKVKSETFYKAWSEMPFPEPYQ